MYFLYSYVYLFNGYNSAIFYHIANTTLLLYMLCHNIISNHIRSLCLQQVAWSIFIFIILTAFVFGPQQTHSLTCLKCSQIKFGSSRKTDDSTGRKQPILLHCRQVCYHILQKHRVSNFLDGSWKELCKNVISNETIEVTCIKTHAHLLLLYKDDKQS